MKDRTVLVSAFIAAVIHAIILFANLGMAPPTLASAPSALEVTLVAAPAALASAPAPEPERPKPPEPPVKSEPEPVIEPEPIPEPEPAVILERVPEPIIEPEPVLFPEPVPEPEPEPVVEPEPIEEPPTEPEEPPAEPVVGATSRVAREEPGDTSQEPIFFPPSVEAPGDSPESGGLVQNPAPTFDRAPAYTYNPKPRYPRAARRLHREGTVVLLVEILASGRVGKIAIDKSSGRELLDNAAVRAVRRWRFEPATKAGIAVRADVKIPVEFNLKDAR